MGEIMNISSIKAYSFNSRAQNFKGNTENNNEQRYENPVNIKTERNLAVLSSVGTSLVTGAVSAGITSVLKGSSPLKKVPLLVGAATGLITLAFTLPSKLYHTKINATVNKKEMDVYTVDKELKKDLAKEVHTEIQNENTSLDDKLNYNMKWQMGNRAQASAVGLASIN